MSKKDYWLEVNIEDISETEAKSLQIEMFDIVKKYAPNANVTYTRSINKNKGGRTNGKK